MYCHYDTKHFVTDWCTNKPLELQTKKTGCKLSLRASIEFRVSYADVGKSSLYHLQEYVEHFKKVGIMS